MKGGVIKRDSRADDFETLFNFISTCYCEILTDSSLTCITYKFTRHDTSTESPYISCRSTNLNQNVNSILLKIFLSGKDYVTHIHKLRSKKNKDGIREPTMVSIPVTHYIDLLKEVNIQEFVYKQSYISQISTCEPICPSIIMFSNTLDKNTEGKLYNYILQTIPLHHRHNTKGIEINDTQITLEWFNKDDKKDDNKDSKQKGIKIIAMELMDGYITLNEYLNNNKENKDKKIKALCKCMWQFVNLSSIIGVSHHDCHFGNIMINENNPYFDDIDIGQPIIIDFGLSCYKHKNKMGFNTRMNQS